MLSTLLHLRPPPTCSREPRSAPATRCVQKEGDPTETAAERSTLLGVVAQGVGGVEGGPRDRYARHRAAVAAAPLPRALDQALGAAHRGPPARQPRDQGPGLTTGYGESPVGCPQKVA